MRADKLGIHEVGQHENARAESLKAREKRGDLPITTNQLARTDQFVNQIESARAIFEPALARNPNQLFWREGTYLLAFYDGDAARMEEQVAWGTRTPGAQDSLLALHSETNEHFGRMRRGRELSQQAVEFARRNDFNERAALFALREAWNEALIGNAGAARLQARDALKLVSDPERNVRALAALTLARAGDLSRARELADELGSQFPSSTLVQKYWLPSIRAEIASSKGNYRGAIEVLQDTVPYDLADTPLPLIPVYIRAEALLGARQGTAAATEFRRILQQRGIVGNSMLGALGHLGLARAYSVSHDESNARRSYQQFFTLWREADHDLPLLAKARAEFAALN